jgi:hypothetical protein
MSLMKCFVLSAAVISASTGAVYGAVLKTPAGADITVDFETAAELGIKGILLMQFGECPSNNDYKRRLETGDEVMKELFGPPEEREDGVAVLLKGLRDGARDVPPPTDYVPVPVEFFACDFDRKAVYFLERKALPDRARPLALSPDRKKVYFIYEPEDRCGKDECPVIIEYDMNNRTSRYLPLNLTPVSDIYYAGKEGFFFFSFVNKKASEGKGFRVENVAKVDVRTGEIKTVPPPEADRHLYAVAEGARLLLGGEDSPDLSGTEDLILCNYNGDVVRVLVESTPLLGYPYARRLSADGKRFLVAEWGKYFGTLCWADADKPDIFVSENAELKNLTQDKLLWRRYEISPDGRMAGIVIPRVDAGGYYGGQYFGVIDINTLNLYEIMDFPKNGSADIISWNM